MVPCPPIRRCEARSGGGVEVDVEVEVDDAPVDETRQLECGVIEIVELDVGQPLGDRCSGVALVRNASADERQVSRRQRRGASRGGVSPMEAFLVAPAHTEQVYGGRDSTR